MQMQTSVNCILTSMMCILVSWITLQQCGAVGDVIQVCSSPAPFTLEAVHLSQNQQTHTQAGQEITFFFFFTRALTMILIKKVKGTAKHIMQEYFMRKKILTLSYNPSYRLELREWFYLFNAYFIFMYQHHSSTSATLLIVLIAGYC